LQPPLPLKHERRLQAGPPFVPGEPDALVPEHELQRRGFAIAEERSAFDVLVSLLEISLMRLASHDTDRPRRGDQVVWNGTATGVRNKRTR